MLPRCWRGSAAVQTGCWCGSGAVQPRCWCGSAAVQLERRWCGAGKARPVCHCATYENSKTDDDGRVSLQWDRPESGGRAAEVMAQERSRADGAL